MDSAEALLSPLKDFAKNSIALLSPLKDFAKNSIRLVTKCQKPDRKEYVKVASRTAVGFLVMGITGSVVKLIFIVINYYFIVGSG